MQIRWIPKKWEDTTAQEKFESNLSRGCLNRNRSCSFRFSGLKFFLKKKYEKYLHKIRCLTALLLLFREELAFRNYFGPGSIWLRSSNCERPNVNWYWNSDAQLTAFEATAFAVPWSMIFLSPFILFCPSRKCISCDNAFSPTTAVAFTELGRRAGTTVKCDTKVTTAGIIIKMKYAARSLRRSLHLYIPRVGWNGWELKGRGNRDDWHGRRLRTAKVVETSDLLPRREVGRDSSMMFIFRRQKETKMPSAIQAQMEKNRQKVDETADSIFVPS